MEGLDEAFRTMAPVHRSMEVRKGFRKERSHSIGQITYLPLVRNVRNLGRGQTDSRPVLARVSYFGYFALLLPFLRLPFLSLLHGCVGKFGQFADFCYAVFVAAYSNGIAALLLDCSSSGRSRVSSRLGGVSLDLRDDRSMTRKRNLCIQASYRACCHQPVHDGLDGIGNSIFYYSPLRLFSITIRALKDRVPGVGCLVHAESFAILRIQFVPSDC